MEILNIEQYNEAVERTRRNDPNLTVLELRTHSLDETVDLNSLVNALKSNTRITQLTIRNSGINDDMTTNLASSVAPVEIE
jgi:hypothetical protein